MDDSSGPTEAGLGVGHHRELRGLEGILEASSTLLLHEQRAVRQPDLFMHSTRSLRDDYHSRHLGPSMGSAVHGMRRAEAARELREAAILAPLVPFDDGTRLWRAFELGQPGAAIDCTAALRAGAVQRAAVTSSLGHGRRSPRCVALPMHRCSRAPRSLGHNARLFCTFSDHALHGYHDQSLDRSTFCGCKLLDGSKFCGTVRGAVVLRLTLYYGGLLLHAAPLLRRTDSTSRARRLEAQEAPGVPAERTASHSS